MISSGVHVAALGFADELFFLHSSVLEPDGDLALREVGGGRNASPLVFGDELAGGVLLFQLLQLDFGVRDTFFAPSTVAADLRLQRHNVCGEKSREVMRIRARKKPRSTSQIRLYNQQTKPVVNKNQNTFVNLRLYFWATHRFRLCSILTNCVVFKTIINNSTLFP